MLATVAGLWAVLGGPAGAETVTVGSCPGAIFPGIQSALDAARPGDTVVVCPGSYAEQLFVTKRLTLRGLPGARIAPVGLRALTATLRTDQPIAAGITLRAPAVVEGLAVDVAAHGITTCNGSEPLLAGVYVRGVQATVLGTSVTGARIGSEPPGCENGIGIFVEGAGGLQRARIEGNSIAAYQRAGIMIENVGVKATIVENLVTGDGPTPDRVQTGMDIGTGVTARITNNLVRDHAGPSGATCELDVGIAVRAARARTTGNQLLGDTIGILAGARGHTIVGNTIDGGTDGFFGLVLDADESRVTSNAIGPVTAAAMSVSGSRNRVRSNVVHDVHAAACETARAIPGCAPRLPECGTGISLEGRANQIVGTVFTATDVTVVDDGRGNVVR